MPLFINSTWAERWFFSSTIRVGKMDKSAQAEGVVSKKNSTKAQANQPDFMGMERSIELNRDVDRGTVITYGLVGLNLQGGAYRKLLSAARSEGWTGPQ